MRWLGPLLSASRPRLWIYLGGTYAVGVVLGAHNLHDLLAWRCWAHLVFFLPFANLLLYGINALCDGEPAELQDTPDTVAQRVMPQHRRLVTYGVLAAVAALCVLLGLARDWHEQLLLGLFLVLAVLDGLPPVRLQARPFFDLFASVLFVLPAFLGYYQTSGQYPAILVMVAALCWTSALRLLSAVQTILPDRDAGVRTTAAALGVRTSLLVCALLWSGFALVVVLQGYLMPLGMVVFVYPLLGFYLFEHFEMGALAATWLPWLNGALGGGVIVLALARLA